VIKNQVTGGFSTQITNSPGEKTVECYWYRHNNAIVYLRVIMRE
jgi:hypothetical protein